METRNLRLAMTAFMVFVMSGFFSVGELRYLAWGRKAPAEVVEAVIGRDPNSRKAREALLATVSFRDSEGQNRTTTLILPPDSQLAAGAATTVQYVPGDQYAIRLDGDRELLWVGIFVAGLLATAAFVGKIVLEAREPVTKKRRPAPPPRR